MVISRENGDEKVLLNIDHDNKGLWRFHVTHSCRPAATLSKNHEGSHVVLQKSERIGSDSFQFPVAEQALIDKSARRKSVCVGQIFQFNYASVLKECTGYKVQMVFDGFIGAEL